MPEAVVTPLTLRWHRWRTRHAIRTARVSPPLWDRSAIGVFWECECGRTWAK